MLPHSNANVSAFLFVPIIDFGSVYTPNIKPATDKKKPTCLSMQLAGPVLRKLKSVSIALHYQHSYPIHVSVLQIDSIFTICNQITILASNAPLDHTPLTHTNWIMRQPRHADLHSTIIAFVFIARINTVDSRQKL